MGLIFAILPSYLKHKNDTQWASLGASGAVSAVLFAYILFQPWKLIFVSSFQCLPLFLLFYTLLIVFGLVKKEIQNINHSAHLWGAAYGVIITILIEPKVLLISLKHFLNFLSNISKLRALISKPFKIRSNNYN
ncbi:rhomboid family intramembrane serine protease [Acinetobacter equi]|uniref:rhomboid family intramembrane serine protease n=1 Tax=Acinetobacter equi TaxID=1324350 RepID=UPI000ABE49E0|nr:rhomboid family intramembrane serine protease [Acinetobacter equi]